MSNSVFFFACNPFGRVDAFSFRIGLHGKNENNRATHTHTHKLCRTLSVLSLAENGESIEMGCEQIGVKEKISKNRVRTCVKRGKYIVEK